MGVFNWDFFLLFLFLARSRLLRAAGGSEKRKAKRREKRFSRSFRVFVLCSLLLIAHCRDFFSDRELDFLIFFSLRKTSSGFSFNFSLPCLDDDDDFVLFCSMCDFLDGFLCVFFVG